MFGATLPIGEGFSSMLIVQMSGDSVHQFIDSLQKMKQVSSELSEKFRAALPTNFGVVEALPPQTVSLTANLVAAAYTGEESCMDFYYASPFSALKVLVSSQLSVNPIVRVTAPTPVFFWMWNRLAAFTAKTPAGEWRVK